MVSPSKFPASTQDAPLSSLPHRPASSSSHSASTHLPDNLDEPLNVQKADLTGSSPSIKGKKRGRGEEMAFVPLPSVNLDRFSVSTLKVNTKGRANPSLQLDYHRSSSTLKGSASHRISCPALENLKNDHLS
ncbi:hypothetical protein LWI29_021138 [Acer saccharum]|uniref:Uncharacterized protein n=1 Tax=Acer saccharum TaxID=4024 RepID=A0AA39RXK1_ACESA|nr:hypothetical protein LWI29_021138 [Acer saccharum]